MHTRYMICTRIIEDKDGKPRQFRVPDNCRTKNCIGFALSGRTLPPFSCFVEGRLNSTEEVERMLEVTAESACLMHRKK